MDGLSPSSQLPAPYERHVHGEPTVSLAGLLSPHRDVGRGLQSATDPNFIWIGRAELGKEPHPSGIFPCPRAGERRAALLSSLFSPRGDANFHAAAAG